MFKQKDILSDLVLPYAYVREETEVRKRKDYYIMEKREPLSQKELIEKIINTSYNKLQKDGRIHGTDKDGNYVSHSVTPYAKDFWKNIEEGVRPLIKALKDKGYLSMSSCAGHSLSDRRFVMLVFPSEAAALSFQDNMPKGLNYILRHSTEVLNTKLNVDEYGNIKEASKQELENDQKNTMMYVNHFIKRNYSDAWFLDVLIIDDLKNKKGFFSKIKHILMKKFFLEYYTRKIVKHIKEKLPFNLY